MGKRLDGGFGRREGHEMAGLCRALRRGARRLSRAYAAAQESEPEEGSAGMWLLDNYYLLQQEYRRARRTAAHIRDRVGFARLCRCLYEEICLLRRPVDSGTLADVLSSYCEKNEPGYEQLSLCEQALRCALLLFAAESAGDTPGEGAEEAFREALCYAVKGLFTIGGIDFSALLRLFSGVERILQQDPAGVYGRMQPQSQQQYHALIARLAHRQGVSETVFARQLLEKAAAAEESPQNHIGYPLLNAPCIQKGRRLRAAGYLSTTLLLSAVFCGIAAWFLGAFAGVLLFLPVYEPVRFLCERLFLCGVPARILPRMDLRRLPPEQGRAMVAVSALLEPVGLEKQIIERLEGLYFSCRSERLCYCLLADLPASPYPTAPADEALIAGARRAVERLNRQYGGRFFLFVRARSYQKTQRCYQGKERKRGALLTLAHYIRGEEAEFLCSIGPQERLKGISYLIALDSDTGMGFETATELIAAAIHPLNRPQYRADGSRCAGYGVLVPRIQPALAGAGSTAFTRLMNGCGGVSGYDYRARDLYGDLFSQAIFTGKGILDIECFCRTCDVFPPGQVLSHDILEGGRMGCAFLGDIEMVDSEPGTLAAFLARAHRWIRGDWQNLPFLLRSFRLEGKAFHYDCPPAVRWQLLDNLRRSLTPAAALACILLSGLFPRRTAFWLCLAAAGSMLFIPAFSAAGMLWRGGLLSLSRRLFARALPQALEPLVQGLVLFVTLPARALSALDAIFRALWRTYISRKNLLEWTTAAKSNRGRPGLSQALRLYLLPELIGLLPLFSPWPSGRVCAVGFSLLLPFALWSAHPLPPRQTALSPEDEKAVRGYAAGMLRFFLDYADASRGFLPPDNVQFSPRYAVAERTSPTNIGFMLLSLLAGRDFELIDTHELYRRVRGAVDSLQEMEKWHGNLYNWYDPRDRSVLQPAFVSSVDSGNLLACLIALQQGLREYQGEETRMEGLLADIGRLIEETDLSRFYVPVRRLFSIGYDAAANRLSPSHYDYLMSEARLLSYCALALRQVDRRHWGALSRALSRCGGHLGPVSWTGTMFEYFMPHLLLPAYEGSLLDEALAYCLYCQKRRVRRRKLPWGVSESGYYAFDSFLNYQYKAHGVGALGVKRGLTDELVLSPYSTFLALPFAPAEALQNLKRLQALGLTAGYGFYEAADFTPGRLSGVPFQPVRSFMAHHVGMSMAACANAVFRGIMQRRFMRNPACAGAAVFLQEKLSEGWTAYRQVRERRPAKGGGFPDPAPEAFEEVSPSSPRAALLSNGDISEIITDCGAGWLHYAGTDCTRRDSDLLLGGAGIYCLAACEGKVLGLSAAPLYQPGWRRVVFEKDAVRFEARSGRLRAEMACFLPPGGAVAVRRVRLQLCGERPAQVKLLFYCEPTLMPAKDFNAHISFARLFLQCERDSATGGLLFTRRAREGGPGCALLCGFLDGRDYAFLPDKSALLRPPYGLPGLADFPGRAFSSQGAPNAICAMCTTLQLSPGGEEQVAFAIAAGKGVQDAREAFIALREAGEPAWERTAPSPLRDGSPEGALGLSLLPRIAFFCPLQPAILKAAGQNRLGQRGLWLFGISGDLPILLLCEQETREAGTLLPYARLLTVLRREGFPFDLAALCPDEEGCLRLSNELEKAGFGPLLRVHGGIFPLVSGRLSQEERLLLTAVAVCIPGEGEPEREGAFLPAQWQPVSPARLPKTGLYVYGGVFSEGCFYMGRRPRVPHCHVLASPAFGTLLSDRSLGYSWYVNARENRITPWSADPSQDNRGERLMLKVDDACYDPVDGARACFGAGFALYEGSAGKLKICIKVQVGARAAQKRIAVQLENTGERALCLQLGWFIEPALAADRQNARLVSGDVDERGIYMQNFDNTAVPCALYMRTDAPRWRHSFDRRRALMGDWTQPGSLPHPDPCGMLIVPLTLPPRRRERVNFVLSCARDRESAKKLSQCGQFAIPCRNQESAHVPKGAAHPAATGYLKLQTPDPQLDAFYNTLLQNQILASRLYGRTGFYQSSGAYGFRDQLQDAMNACPLSPAILRIQIARCCAVQFLQGDVLHWWHVLPGGKQPENAGVCGVRTRCSDDMAWLPLAIALYLKSTGDSAFLKREIAYLSGEELRPDETDRYFWPAKSGVKESVYRHGLRALERAHALSPRGLVKIGSGDWNDGFSSVGKVGRGESSWLTMFLALCCERYAVVCTHFGDTQESLQLTEWARSLREAADRHCWDGAWYSRATFDDGTLAGSRQSAECQIDSLPQSFAALSGMPDKQRVKSALGSALQRLVDEENGIIRLFTPPFEHSDPSPGYIQAYPPGIRENGGQYTHAAVWLAQALLREGRAEDGYRLLHMLNPVSRACSLQSAARYGLEPYYLAADIYTHPALYGHGGWSIYTGAAGWYFHTVTKEMLGLCMEKGALTVRPTLPETWEQAQIEGVLCSTAFSLLLRRGKAGEEKGLFVDGRPFSSIPLDGGQHQAVFIF